MLTVEERLAAYRSVLDGAVDDPADGALAPHRTRTVHRSWLVLGAAAVVLVLGMMLVATRQPGAAPVDEPSSPPVTTPPATETTEAPGVAYTIAPTTTSVATLPSQRPDSELLAELGAPSFVRRTTFGAAEQGARNALMAQCMNAQGLPYARLPIGVNIMAPASDAERAAVREWRTRDDSYRQTPGYREAEEGDTGCIGMVAAQMYPDLARRSAVLLENLRTEAYLEIEARRLADPEFLHGLQELATCLADQGYDVDASLAEPRVTERQIDEIRESVHPAAEPVDPAQFEFIPDLIEATDRPLNAICPMWSDVSRTAFHAAVRRAGDAWLAEHPDRFVPVQQIMLEEYRRFLSIVESDHVLVGRAVTVGQQRIEVTRRDHGHGMCVAFVVDLVAGCDTIDPDVATEYRTAGGPEPLLYGFMPADWQAWIEIDGRRTEVAVSEPDGDGRVAFAAALQPITPSNDLVLVQVDGEGNQQRHAVPL